MTRQPRRAWAAFTKSTKSGLFWSPSNPDAKFDATFVRGRHGRATTRFAASDEGTSVPIFNRADVAHGELDDGTLVTLWSAYPDDNFARGTSKRRHHVWTNAVLDAHLPNENETPLAASSVSFEGIDMWTRIGPIGHDEPKFEYPPAVLEDVYGEGYTVTVRIVNAAVTETMSDGNVRFSRFLGEDGRISFETSPAAPLEFHRRLWFDLSSLVSFCTSRATHFFDYRILPEGGHECRLVEYRAGKPPFMRTPANQMVLAPRQLTPTVLFPAWWDALDSFYPVPQILAGRHMTRRAFVEGHTMAALGAAERMHSHLKMGKRRFPDAFFDARKERIREAIAEMPRTRESDDYDTFVTEVLQNARPFVVKMRELAERAGRDQLLAADFDPDLWLEGVKTARNRLAHTGSHVSGRGGEQSDLLYQVDQGTRVVLSLLLREQLTGSPMSPGQARLSLAHPRWKMEPAAE